MLRALGSERARSILSKWSEYWRSADAKAESRKQKCRWLWLLLGLLRFLATIGRASAVNVSGSRIQERVLDSFEMRRILTKLGGVAAEFLAQQLEAGKNDGAVAAAAFGDLIYGEAFGAVQEKNSVQGSLAEAVCCVQCFGQSEGLAGDAFAGRVFRVGAEIGEEFAGSGFWMEGAMLGEGDVLIVLEKTGVHIGEKFLAGRVEIVAGWSEEDEGLAQADRK